ncbi:MAG: DUF4263 domain-containing protein [Alphaproteobacteria bacterium]|nr:DUF4263 domain-containing protein [Alphaproteobacteria bacterium]
MIYIVKNDNKLLLKYQTNSWVQNKLEKENKVTICRTFTFKDSDCIEGLIDRDEDEHLYQDEKEYTFILGELKNSYYVIDKRILDIDFNLLIEKSMEIWKNDFYSENPNQYKISIFKKINKLVDEPIIIGGKLENSIPIKDFKNFVQKFPNKTELTLYSHARITNVLSEYFDTMEDSDKKLQNFLNKKNLVEKSNNIVNFDKYELKKYVYISEEIKKMLRNPNRYSEKQWQNLMIEFLLIIYPKYIGVLDNVNIKDFYSNPKKTTNRYIDIALLDSNGNVDIIEIKKPTGNSIISSGKYRDNYTPKKELSGTVMQIEKYLFHLNKWGLKGEEYLNKKYADKFNNEIKIKITNPKGIIILGRDKCFTDEQLFDFEIMKRKYANVIDILTYDDLLRRLDNIISKFSI